MSLRSKYRDDLGDWPKAVNQRIADAMCAPAPLASRVDVALGHIRQQIEREAAA